MGNLYFRFKTVLDKGTSGLFLSFVCILLAIICPWVSAQSYHFQWVLEAGNVSSSDEGIAIAADPAGNNWVIGRFYGQPVFADTVMMCGEDMNFFLVMHNAEAQLNWVRYVKRCSTKVRRAKIATEILFI